MEAKRTAEAVLFAASRPVTVEELTAAGIKKKMLKQVMNELVHEYEDSAIEIVDMDGKFVMQLRNEYAEKVKMFAPMELSKGLLKTLAIIAYHQPVLQSKLKSIVGSQVYDYVKDLKDKGFIKAQREGRTKKIEATSYFYDYFGFNEKNKDKMRATLYKRLHDDEQKEKE